MEVVDHRTATDWCAAKNVIPGIAKHRRCPSTDSFSYVTLGYPIEPNLPMQRAIEQKQSFAITRSRDHKTRHSRNRERCTRMPIGRL